MQRCKRLLRRVFCDFWCVAPGPFGPMTYHQKPCVWAEDG